MTRYLTDVHPRHYTPEEAAIERARLNRQIGILHDFSRWDAVSKAQQADMLDEMHRLQARRTLIDTWQATRQEQQP